MHSEVTATRNVRAWVLGAIAVVTYVLVALWLTDNTWSKVYSTRLDRGWLTDFRDAIYYPSRALLQGINPYDPSVFYETYPVGQEFPLYSPVHLVMHLPFAALSLATARAVYFCLNICLMVVLAGTALRLAGHALTVAKVFAFATLLLLSNPGFWDLRTGESTLIFVLGIYLALACGRSRPGWATIGVVLALGKPTFGVVLVVLMLCRRETRAAINGTLIAIAISIIGSFRLAGGFGGAGDFITSLRESFETTTLAPQSRLGSSLRVDAFNTFARLSHSRPAETIATIGALALLGVGVFIVAKLHHADPSTDQSEVAITLALLLLLVPLFHVHYDLLILAWPLALLLHKPFKDIAPWPRYWRALISFMLLIAMIAPTRWTAINQVLSRSKLARLSGPTVAGLCILAVLFMAGWTAWRASQTANSLDPEPLAHKSAISD